MAAKAALSFAVAVWLGGFALLVYGCGETASSDCATKATCPDDAASASDTLTEGMGEVSVTDGCLDGGACGHDAEGGGSCNGVCAATAPAGWMGPMALYTGGGMGGPLPTPPTCPSPFADDVVDGNSELDAPPADCMCTCSVMGATCPTGPTWFVYGDPTCSTAPCASTTVADSTCHAASGCDAGQSFKAVAAPPDLSGASCVTALTMPTPPPWSWGAVVRGCGYTGPTDTADCTAGALCIPAPAAPLGSSLCIYGMGDQMCPAGPYTVKTAVYTMATDDRSCQPCSCGPLAGGTCGVSGMLTTFSGPVCMLATGSYAVDGVCHASPTSFVDGSLTSTGAVGVSCTATSAGPTGMVTPTGATTVCCTP